MPLRYRITLLIAFLLFVSMAGNTVLLVWYGKQAILERTQGDGVAITRLLANGVALAERIPDVVNEQIGRQMVAEAALAAQLIDLGKQQGLSSTAISARLAEVVARTPIRRIMAISPDGTPSADAAPEF